MSDDVQFQLYSPTLGTLDLTASFDGYSYLLYGAQFGVATPATSTAQALIGQSVTSSGFEVRDDVSFYLGITADIAGDGASLTVGSMAVEAWNDATDAEFRYKPRGGAWCCLPIIVDLNDPDTGIKVAPVQAPVGGVDVVVDESTTSVRWLQITLTCAPFVLAAAAVTEEVALSSSVGSIDRTGTAKTALTITLSGGELDKCLVYMAPKLPAGFSPLLRGRMGSGGATLNRGGEPAFYSTTWRALSGLTSTIADGTTLPAGGYAVIAHLYNNTSAQTLSIPVTVTANGDATTALSTSLDLPADDTLFEGIAGFVLPAATGSVTISFGTAANVYLDEVFILPMSTRAFHWLTDAGSLTEASVTAPVTSNQVGAMSPAVAIDKNEWPVLNAATMTLVAASAGVAEPVCAIEYRPAVLTFTPGVEDTAA